MPEPVAPIEEGARYANFQSVLDCGECGNEILVEGDVSNGEVVECEGCEARLEVYNR